MPDKIHRYTKGNLTVIWKPEQCIHSTLCWKNLGRVFNPRERPWIKLDGASAEAIIQQVKKCPSGALSFEIEEGPADHYTADASDSILNPDRESSQETLNAPIVPEAAVFSIRLRPDGPILIQHDCEITYSDGRKEIIKGNVALCRCGNSGNKPFCDGSHRQSGFKG
jgi:uncharacterized Fe-S cluster protein YjdI